MMPTNTSTITPNAVQNPVGEWISGSDSAQDVTQTGRGNPGEGDDDPTLREISDDGEPVAAPHERTIGGAAFAEQAVEVGVGGGQRERPPLRVGLGAQGAGQRREARGAGFSPTDGAGEAQGAGGAGH